ncbi:repeat domain in Vibrio, Colwellia, Bradyrhizobium and Shewanella [Antarctobacter heliothermus]|uniref:Repeat domain in Vibrio, Colwellia, Bradyrhizobium and Shewanella n=1 Tax=Antarctobacter heliothermus TaxID=74033 RepID=A0A222DYA7_9RHOB|nr:FG-GAP-like repeat-containing protein [Antarctobacter heliothermus]ASP18939.1 repeat domain in Vibrio, Colwellia, Bradyrhizobium and Shewanella [Antarctobacter heliothermus]
MATLHDAITSNDPNQERQTVDSTARTDWLRLAIASTIVIVLAYLFWTGSRYPALDEKAMMSGGILLEDPLGFEAKYPLTEDMTVLQRMFWSTLNWINTNKKGMTFGVLFAAAFLTAAPYVRRKSFNGGFANSALGLAIGTPLGVCVNCAAPIARGMYTGGLRAETTLSAMIASPTLNVVVLTMLFSLLPFYMALTKIALSLLVILVFVPLICRHLPQKEIPPAQRVATVPPAPLSDVHRALWDVLVSYLKNLWYIVKMTVPLMLLAGMLGAVVATLLPQDLITGLNFSLIVLVLIALVGVFLPVPIAFDVVVTGALLGLGLSHGYVMALLFTLGSFSVYSFFIVAQSVGLRAGLWLAASIAGLGILSGAGAHYYHEWQTDRALRMLTGEASHAPLLWAAQAAEGDPWTVTTPDAPRIIVEPRPFASPSPAAETVFTRLEGWEIGLAQPIEFSMADMWPPFWEGRSLASGDIDGDGDIDLAVASTEVGLRLYSNDGTGQFTPMEIDLGPLSDAPVFNAVLVDINNDGWRDLLLATYQRGNFTLMNGPDGFGVPQQVDNTPDAPLSMALTFGDPDRDGDLDLGVGNWAAGWYRRIPGEESRNRVIWNEGGALTGTAHTVLPGIPGETLSMLFTDLNSDGKADLLVGNDFEVPDYYYLGDGAGGFRAITHQDGIIPHTTTTTMAIKTVDLTNDGAPELYLAQIAGRSSGVSAKLKMQPLDRYCDAITRDDQRAVCARNMAIKQWYRSGNSFDPSYASRCQDLSGRDQAECKAMLIKDLAIQRKDADLCGMIPAGQYKARAYCDVHFMPSRPFTAEEADAALPQIQSFNVLLTSDGAGGFTDVAKDMGLEIGGWSWDTKIADFDEDGLKDVYIVNGTWVPNEVSPSNLFYHNTGNGFAEASGPFGLEDYLMTAAGTQFDMDGDGDLDIVTYTVNGPLAVFRNNTQEGRALTVSFEDLAGNRDGIGATIRVTDTNGVTRMQELQLGGGFMSFDAPVAHFGLGAAVEATRVAIRWADGDETVIEGKFAAETHYRIRRAAD